METILKELQELKNLTLMACKTALSMDEAAEFTGLSKSHLYKCVSARALPFYKSKGGKLTYFHKDELTSWLLNTRVKTSDELNAEALNYVVNGKGSAV